MGRFEFSKNELTLDIEGVEVKVDRDQTLEKMENWGKKSNELDGKSIAEQREFMLDALDDILGESAMDAIMENRNLSYVNCCELYVHIAEVAAKVSTETVAKAMNMPNKTLPAPQTQPMAMAAVENRAARRAKRRR